MDNIISSLRNNLLNIPGYQTKRKIVVIESDDWGSIRMPSKRVHDQFIKMGVDVNKDPYCRYDSIASRDDLECIFEVLTSVHDKNKRNAVITANTVVTNPDFEKIKANGFKKYFYKPFIETLKNQNDNNIWELWQQGITGKIFHPQFHGREHLNINKWLSALQDGDEITRLAFDYGTFGLTSLIDQRIGGNYMGAFNSNDEGDVIKYKQILKEGLNIFENIFHYRSKSFIATTYTWPTEIEPFLREFDVKYLQGMIHQRIPIKDGNFKYKKNNFIGTKSASGLIYLMRNCYFEPSQYPQTDWLRDCLRRIKIAFRWNKPATISVHRLNFIGAIDESNRTVNLKLFRKLLKELVTKYPDVEFMTSDELGQLIVTDITKR